MNSFPLSFPALGHRKRLGFQELEGTAPDRAVHPDAKSIRFETERQCFPAAPWRIDTFIPLSVCLQSPRTSEPGFITWSLCVGPRIRSKRKGKRELNAVPTPVNKHRLK